MCNRRECGDGGSQSKRDDERCLDAIYSEICSSLSDFGWKLKIETVRNFTLIYILDVSLSIFISDGMLFVVKGNKLPPVIYKEDINKPGFDIIEKVNEICAKFFTSPEKL